MDSRNRPTSAWISGVIIVIVIVILSLGAAIICFKILESSAEANLQNWKVGGGIAAFLVTASFLSSTFFTLYKLLTSDQIEEYRKQIQELETKLIKGAPCPPGYTIDVDEKHKLVFARPQEWEPKGGILYEYIEKQKPDDAFVANFNVIYVNGKDLAKAYPGIESSEAIIVTMLESEMAKIEKSFPDGKIVSEFVVVDSIKSAKYVITRVGKFENQESSEPEQLLLRQSGILTYVQRLNALFIFTFSDNQTDFLRSSAVFNNVIQSIRFL